MADQATMNNHTKPGTATNPERSGAASPSSILEDVAVLAELQARLAAIELRRSLADARLPLLLTLLGLVIALAAALLALQAAGNLLAQSLTLAQPWSMLLTAGLAAVVALSMIGLGSLQIRASFRRQFQGSLKQFPLNVRWLRAMLNRGVTHEGQ